MDIKAVLEPKQQATIIPHSGRKADWQAWLGVLLSLGCLVLILRGIEWKALFAAVQELDPGWLAFACGISIATLLAKAARWRLLFEPNRGLSFRQSFSRLSIGMLLNLFAPVRLGDVARASLVAETGAANIAFTLGTILFEKVLDLAVLLISILLLLTHYALPPWLVNPSLALATVFGISLFVLLLVTWKGQGILRGVTRVAQSSTNPWMRWVLSQARFGLDSLEILHTPTRLIGPLFWSGLIWALGFLTNYFVFRAAGLALSIWPAIFLLVVLQVGVAVPSSPGRIGVFHYLTVISLAFFDVPKEISLVCGMVLHLVVIVPLTLSGSWYLWRERIDYRELFGRVIQLRRFPRPGK